jgi:hypothetical protein
MPNGKIGDHPITDLLIHGRHPFPQEIEDMILEIVRLDSSRTFDGLGTKPFDWEEGKNLDEARELLGKTIRNLKAKMLSTSTPQRHSGPRVYIPARSPEDWRPLLADPEKHWRARYSAMELAKAWQEANGFPSEVQKAFGNSGIDLFQALEVLLAIPEHQVPLPPEGGRPTQCDLFALARGGSALVAIAVEGKVAEPFGPIVAEWLADRSEGKQVRLRFICDLLGLKIEEVQGIRYQLLHRAAAALIEAERFSASHALMLVHSFSQSHDWFADYATFARLYGVAEPKVDTIIRARRLGDRILYLGWVSGAMRK